MILIINHCRKKYSSLLRQSWSPLSSSTLDTLPLLPYLYKNQKNIKRSSILKCGRTKRSFTTVLPTKANPIVDLRSDTVTQPSPQMLESCLKAKTGDDVLGEDPTVLMLEDYAADLFRKESALYVPTGTMGNLCAVMAHCHERASEVIMGSQCHMALYEGGNIANLAGVHSRQLQEDPVTCEISIESIRKTYRTDNDDHYAKTKLVCIENTHNVGGGVALHKKYIDEVGACVKSFGDDNSVKIHIDGARIFNAALRWNIPVSELCASADSVSVCLSKGLGAPVGTVLVGDKEFIRLARRARKRCGGGMRQSGVVAAMGYYALTKNVERMEDDHRRANTFAMALKERGFYVTYDSDGNHTNLVFFAQPKSSSLSDEELCKKLKEMFGVLLYGGYKRANQDFELIRAAFHMDVDDKGVNRAIHALEALCCT